jgi:hypothetical protein
MILRIKWPLQTAVLLAVLVVLGCANGTAETTTNTAEAKGEQQVAATIGDRTITLAELDAKAMTSKAEVFQALYEARKAVLDQMLAEELVGERARANGIDQDQFIQREVLDKLEPISDAAAEAFYNQNSGQMGGKSLAEMAPQIKGYLKNQASGKAVQGYLRGLMTEANVKVMLDPPRTDVSIAENDPRHGPDDARIKIVMFSEFQ